MLAHLFYSSAVIYFVLIGPPGGVAILQIIGAIGLSMIVLGAAVWLRPFSKAVTVIGLTLVRRPQRDSTPFMLNIWSTWSALWKIMHERERHKR